MKKLHEIKDVYFEGEYMLLTIDQHENKFHLNEISTSLAKSTKIERNTFEISSSGYGIHWPLIDEDISIDGLLGIIHKKASRQKTA